MPFTVCPETQDLIRLILQINQLQPMHPSSPLPRILLILLVSCCIPHSQTKAQALQILGFEAWQDPSPQQIKQQYMQLINSYKATIGTDPAAAQKYKQINQAIKELRDRGYVSEQVSSGQQRQRKPRAQARQSQYHRQGGRQSGFYTHSDEFYAEGSATFQLNIEQILKSINLGFINVQPGQHQNQPLQANIDLGSFFWWLLSHPQIILAALLISFGVINLCTCCCCCYCCRCCKKDKNDKNEGRKQSRDRERNKQQKYRNKSL